MQYRYKVDCFSCGELEADTEDLVTDGGQASEEEMSAIHRILKQPSFWIASSVFVAVCMLMLLYVSLAAVNQGVTTSDGHQVAGGAIVVVISVVGFVKALQAAWGFWKGGEASA